jgi:hypothetical protein
MLIINQYTKPACIPAANEIHTNANAVSLYCNEINSTDGWGIGGSSGTLNVITGGAQNGDFYFAMIGAPNTSERMEYSWTANVGDTYEISIWAKVPVYTAQYFGNWSNLTNSPASIPITNNNWQEYTFSNIIATSTGICVIRIYAHPSLAGGVADEVHVDSVSIIKIN